MKCDHPHSHAGFHQTMQIIGEKWTIDVLHNIRQGRNRFGLLRKELPGISSKTLAERLRSLENEGLILRKTIAESPLHVEYSLTDRGMSLGGVIAGLDHWGQG